jgi:hypothetical protein
MVKNAKPLPTEVNSMDGAMAEWLGRALQKLARRFDSGSCLQIYLPEKSPGRNEPSSAHI